MSVTVKIKLGKSSKSALTERQIQRHVISLYILEKLTLGLKKIFGNQQQNVNFRFRAESFSAVRASGDAATASIFIGHI